MLKTLFVVGLSMLVASAAAWGQYDRRSYGGWWDEDGDCLNTRHEVLAAESLIPPVIVNCKVIEGLWYDLYTGRTYTNPKRLDVDHVVPLKEADISGGSSWNREKKQRYANDLDNPGHLIAVSASANRSKGSRDVAKWLPENSSFHCAYVGMWVEVKKKWGLTLDLAEQHAITKILRRCT